MGPRFARFGYLQGGGTHDILKINARHSGLVIIVHLWAATTIRKWPAIIMCRGLVSEVSLEPCSNAGTSLSSGTDLKKD